MAPYPTPFPNDSLMQYHMKFAKTHWKRTWLTFVGFYREQNCCTPSTSFVLAQYQSAICPEKPTIGRFWFRGISFFLSFLALVLFPLIVNFCWCLVCCIMCVSWKTRSIFELDYWSNNKSILQMTLLNLLKDLNFSSQKGFWSVCVIWIVQPCDSF